MIHMKYIIQSHILPVYPGSYWEYSNGNVIRVGNDYELVEIFQSHLNFGTRNVTCTSLETAYFPKYGNHYVKGYTRYGIGDESCSTKTLLSETLGEVVDRGASKYGRTELKVVLIDSTVTLPNNKTYENVIVTRYRKYQTGLLFNEYQYYYAKDVGYLGMQHMYIRDFPWSFPLWNFYLENYYINN